jgi:hypothetical protein
MSPVMGNITSLYMAIEKRKRWDLFLELEFPDFVGSELNFWKNFTSCSRLSGKLI